MGREAKKHATVNARPQRVLLGKVCTQAEPVPFAFSDPILINRVPAQCSDKDEPCSNPSQGIDEKLKAVIQNHASEST